MADDRLDEALLVAAKYNADVILYNGSITYGCDKICAERVRAHKVRENVVLILVTYGGAPDAAFRISRTLQRAYKRFIMFITGPAKSAGTLVTLGAHELIVSDSGELGPLDMQLAKSDELWQMRSGHTATDALTSIEARAREMFKATLVDIKRSYPSVTLKTAMQIATELAGTMYSSLLAQVDPMHLGEAARELKVAVQYGSRLSKVGGNIDDDKLMSLVASYPSHGFVIDRDEASSLFKVCRAPDDVESALEDALGKFARTVQDDGTYIEYLSAEEEDEQAGANDERAAAANAGQDSARESEASSEAVGSPDSVVEIAQFAPRGDA